MCLSKDCPILIPFRLPQISCLTLGLKCSSCDSDNSLLWGSDPCFGSPTRRGQVQSYQHSCFCPGAFALPSFAWFYVFFSSGQVLLSAPSWCSACTSVSEGELLMDPRGRMYSKSTCSSTTLFSSVKRLFFFKKERAR